jgi:hypothetical protein
MTVRKSLPYQGIARRALSIKHASGNYNKDIDISAFLPKRRFNVIDREKEKEMSKTKRHMYDPLYDPLGSDSFVGTEEFPSWVPKDLSPLVTPEEAAIIDKFYEANPNLKQTAKDDPSMAFNEDAWIQTYSGRRFNPTNPVVEAIVIQDIAHSLSMQCRFSGHVKRFYSVAQHSVLVSYICDYEDALWGLMHDASEAYLVDVPRPLKRSGKFDAYLTFEDNMQKAICKRFGLPEKEPKSIKLADQALLATEARDLMAPLRSDWIQPCDPLPFKIDPLPQQEAKDLFMKRFFELTNSTNGYAHYMFNKE